MYWSVVGNNILKDRIKQSADAIIVIALIQTRCMYWERITRQLWKLAHAYPDINFIRAVVTHHTGSDSVKFLIIKQGVTLEEFTSNTASGIPKILEKYICNSQQVKEI